MTTRSHRPYAGSGEDRGVGRGPRVAPADGARSEVGCDDRHGAAEDLHGGVLEDDAPGRPRDARPTRRRGGADGGAPQSAGGACA